MNILVRRLAVGLSIAALVAVSGVPVGAGGRATDSTPSAPADHDYVMVRLADRPLASYTGGVSGYARTKPQPGRKLNLNSNAARAYARYLAGKRQNYKRWLETNAPRAEVVREYAVVFNGLTIKLNGERIEHIATGTGARRVSRSFLVRPSMNVSPALINADDAWAALGGTGPSGAGTGVKVGIIDTGIDTSNPFLSDGTYPSTDQADACAPFVKPDGGPRTNNKVVVCRFYTSGVAPGAHVELDDLVVFDHGTHVAGTVAGNAGTTGTVAVGEETIVTLTGTLSGIAPRALLGDYNVFPGFGAGFVAFDGSAFSHDIARALEDAVTDGMDVLNMSLGGPVQGPHDFLAEAVDATVDAGLVVAVAAGNSGPGDATVESPGSAAGALTAGASTNPHFIGIPVTVGSTTFGAAVGDFNPYDPPVSAALLDWNAIDGAESGLACTALGSGAAAGKIVLVRRGACTFTTKIRNAQNAGAVGVLVVNNVVGDPVAMAHDGTDPEPVIPAVMVSRADQTALEALAAASATASGNGTSPAEFITGNADFIAGFSSRGPTPFTYLIKPDLTAPGVNVASSVFDQLFAFFQGTSMATPHLAGSAALLLDMFPSWTPADVKSALVNTAKRPVGSHTNGAPLASPLARGGGRVDLAAAMATPLTFNPASVSFGFWGGNRNVAATRTVSVKNVSGAPQSCTVDVTGPDIASASVSTLSVGAGGTTTFTLALSAGTESATASGDYTGDVAVDCGGSLLRVPWWVRIDRGGKP